MDTGELNQYRRALESILREYAAIPYPGGEIESDLVIDRERDRYLLLEVGWEKGYRIHGVLIHVDIIDGKLWIQQDGTEEGIATELVAAGVPKERIVLAFRPPIMRQHTEFAAA